MKKLLLLLAFTGLIIAGCNKETKPIVDDGPVIYPLVSTDATPRNAVLEEFTGIHCGYCPDGHQVAAGIYNDNPGRIVLINIHATSYADPNPGEPDFRTPYGPQLASFGGVSGVPTAMINREIYGSEPKLVMSRSIWPAAAQAILSSGNTPVNVGMASKYNPETHSLAIRVELYYREATAGNDKLNVVFLENGYIGYQTNGGANYEHNHILREMITGTWGETIETTVQGTKVVKEYTYDMPTEYDVENCDVVAFVTASDNKTTYTGIKVEANGGNTYVTK